MLTLYDATQFVPAAGLPMLPVHQVPTYRVWNSRLGRAQPSARLQLVRDEINESGAALAVVALEGVDWDDEIQRLQAEIIGDALGTISASITLGVHCSGRGVPVAGRRDELASIKQDAIYAEALKWADALCPSYYVHDPSELEALGAECSARTESAIDLGFRVIPYISDRIGPDGAGGYSVDAWAWSLQRAALHEAAIWFAPPQPINTASILAAARAMLSAGAPGVGA